jgi:glycosyltransferase involved in cell wall biosynthesis
MKNKPVRIVLVATNDLEGDQRLHKMALSLKKMGWAPSLIGRQCKGSKELRRPYPVERLRLLFNKGPLFYSCFNLRIFIILLLRRAELFVANDLDTLPGVWAASKLRGIPMVYDSHEYFTEVPELVNRKGIKKIWKNIEKFIQPGLSCVITVNDSIAQLFRDEYGNEVSVISNFPSEEAPEPAPGSLPPGFSGKPLIIYQGAVNKGRGLEELLRALPLLPECRIIIAGGGDLLGKIMKMADHMGLSNRIHFTGKLPFEELRWYTRQARIGVSLEQDIGLNYRYSLPNKLFDYMKEGLPVVASDLPEISRVVRESVSGILISDFSPSSLAGAIGKLLEDQQLYSRLSENALSKSALYTWEGQEQRLHEIYSRALEGRR